MKHNTSWKTCTVVISTCLTALLSLPLLAISADNTANDTAGAKTEAVTIPETVDINLQQQCPGLKGLHKDKKQVKGFTHRKHATEYLKGREKFSKYPYTDQLTCTACHPGAASAKAINKEKMCESIGAELETVGGPAKMAKFYHNTCKSCHSAMKKAGEKSGPTSCKGCHGK